MKVEYIPLRSWDDFPSYGPTSITVLEREVKPQPTGILNADGTMLYRVERSEPIGFRLREPKP